MERVTGSRVPELARRFRFVLVGGSKDHLSVETILREVCYPVRSTLSICKDLMRSPGHVPASMQTQPT